MGKRGRQPQNFFSLFKQSPDPDGCWEWQGGKSQGYGVYTINGKNFLAHRYSWEQEYGPIPPGIFVCHHCDNPPCIRPAHLFLGTAKDNMQDAKAKGRMPHGTGHWSAKDAEIADRIRMRLTETTVHETKNLVEEFGVSMGVIHFISVGTHWTRPDGVRILRKLTPQQERAHNRKPRVKKSRKYRKLVPDQVAEIRARWAQGESQNSLSRQYGVSQPHIHDIVHNKNWAAL